MGESLTQRRRVREEGPRVVNRFSGRTSYVIYGIVELIPGIGDANSVPAAAVKQNPLALSGFTGRKEFVGGSVSLMLKLFGLNLRDALETIELEGVRGWRNARCRGEIR